ncbi:Asp-tRNA(Asn)/Glu-tRNA(Gln) amidotransferase subunit GatC [bacterium]|nr:Asp-tRNA(Asn)/Glu-tRNA(Gln) amidotransferase subunit GatC [bacterium]
MPVTINDVKKIASLAYLEFTSEETERYCGQLNQILQYVEKLNQLDTSNVEITYHPITYPDVFREDEVQPCLPVDQALRNAPDKNWQYIVVPKVVS